MTSVDIAIKKLIEKLEKEAWSHRLFDPNTATKEEEEEDFVKCKPSTNLNEALVVNKTRTKSGR